MTSTSRSELSSVDRAYGPCTAGVRAVLGRASGLSAFEIIALAQARAVMIDVATWNAAIDALDALTDATGRQHCSRLAAEEAARLTWLAATTATALPPMIRAHVVSHGVAFHEATDAAAKLVSVAAMVAAVGDRLAPLDR